MAKPGPDEKARDEMEKLWSGWKSWEALGGSIGKQPVIIRNLAMFTHGNASNLPNSIPMLLHMIEAL